jgi:hypothetical protein
MLINYRIVAAHCKTRINDNLTPDAIKARKELKRKRIGAWDYQQLASAAWLLLLATAEKEHWTVDTDIEAYLRKL